MFCWTLILLDEVTNDRRKVEISAQIKTDFPLMCNESRSLSDHKSPNTAGRILVDEKEMEAVDDLRLLKRLFSSMESGGFERSNITSSSGTKNIFLFNYFP